MNLDIIKNEVINNKNKSVVVKIYGARNRVDTVKGVIKDIYPNIFTVVNNDELYSFRYADIITKEIKLKYM